ncbi:TPA: DUF87 domain-containing protein, partial [Candidatus Micrarchaeota archaeon]|nr:DUF87 domain-containing protein [Candidatus Micrarchaeota archaeon]
MKGEVVGRVTGDSRSHKFVFSVNPLSQPSLYEYVYVEVQEAPPGEEGLKTVPVLAQVVDMKRVGVAVSPDHPWSVIKDVPDRGVQDLVVATARVLGYKHGDRIYYPRRPPQVGSWVYRAPDSMVSQFYSVPARRALRLGYLISRPSVPVYLDLAGLERHLAIIAATGGGKTWPSIVLIEELVKKGATVLVLDPHGEYVKLRDSIHKLGPQYRSRVLVVKGHRSQEGDVLYRISVGSLDGEELASVAGVPPHATRVRAVIASARDIAGLLAKATGSRRYCSVRGVMAIVEAALASAARFRSAGSKASWELLVQGFVRELEASLTELAGRLLEPEYK